MPLIGVIPRGRTRIAPTPSGFLHPGNAFNFLLTDRLARDSGSVLALRIDDTDRERARPEYLADIFRTLERLGIAWDEGPGGPEEHLRERKDGGPVLRRLHRLRQQGLLYACRCSRREFSPEPHACRSGEVAVGEGASERLRVPKPCPVLVPGWDMDREVDLFRTLPDPVIVLRNSGSSSYQIQSLCADSDRGVSFVVRGADLLPSSACQVHLAERLEESSFARIRFVHHPLIRARNGEKLSKSAGAERQPMDWSRSVVAGLREAVSRFLEEGVFNWLP